MERRRALLDTSIIKPFRRHTRLDAHQLARRFPIHTRDDAIALYLQFSKWASDSTCFVGFIEAFDLGRELYFVDELALSLGAQRRSCFEPPSESSK